MEVWKGAPLGCLWMGSKEVTDDILLPIGYVWELDLQGRHQWHFGNGGCLVTIDVLRRGEVFTRDGHAVNSSI